MAEGFKTLFPDVFTRLPRDILDAYSCDPAARILRWDPFLNKLAEHYWLHISPSKDKTAIYQTRSAFDSCSREALLKFYGIYKHKHAEDILDSPPDPKFFERVHASDLDGETMRPRGFSTNDFTGFQLRFYIPVFIWAYNEVKRCLLPEQQRFESISRSLYRQLRYLKTLEGKPELVLSFNVPEVNTLRLDLGVALEVRKGQFCKEYLGIATMETQEDGRGETKGENMTGAVNDGTSGIQDVEMGQGDSLGDIPMDDVPSTGISTKRKRVTFNLLGEELEGAPRPTRRLRVGFDHSGASCMYYPSRSVRL